MPFRLIFALAWRNLWRTPRRSGLTILINAVGVMGILVFGGFALYTFDSLKEQSARDTGHVILAKSGYFSQQEDVPMQLGFEPTAELMQQLQADTRVRYALPSVQLSGLISNGQKTVVYMGKGMDAREFAVKGVFLTVKQGGLLSLQEKPDALPEVLLGEELASYLKAKVGDDLTIMTSTVSGVLNAIDVQVKGIVSMGIPEVDKHLVLMSIGQAQGLLDTHKVSQIALFLTDINDTQAVTKQLISSLSGFDVQTWDEQAVFYHKVRDLYQVIFGVVGVVVMILVFFAISNTLSMIILERTREIGTLAALGTRSGEILALFISEAGLMGAIGAFVGAVLAGIISLLLNAANIHMPPPPGRSVGYPLYIYFDLQMTVAVIAAVIVCALMAAWLSARSAVKKPIVEALSYV
jgi:putative ABC transport system permease protein